VAKFHNLVIGGGGDGKIMKTQEKNANNNNFADN
jgi:hypothetical protein